MHDGEVPVDSETVRRLVADQLPHLVYLPVTEVRSTATVNAVYRLGDRLCVRLPRMEQWAQDLDKECHWLPRLAPQLSLQIPRPVAKGQADAEYPFAWAVFEWIDGQPYSDDLVADEGQAAHDLARFVTELHGIDITPDAPRGGRKPLRELDAVTRTAITAAAGVIDAGAALAAWEHACAGPVWDGVPTWIHSDLLRPNLLVRDGRLCGVLDFGGAGVGDPATDVIAAWSVFGRHGRETFRQALDVDAATWTRARGIALHQAALIIPYYEQTNPGFVRLAVRTVEQLLSDGPFEAA